MRLTFWNKTKASPFVLLYTWLGSMRNHPTNLSLDPPAILHRVITGCSSANDHQNIYTCGNTQQEPRSPQKNTRMHMRADTMRKLRKCQQISQRQKWNQIDMYIYIDVVPRHCLMIDNFLLPNSRFQPLPEMKDPTIQAWPGQ